jgi:electron transport complex protein RnfC
MSRIWETPGGIYPPANKRQSLSLPIDYPELPERLVVPLGQHAGRPCRACVEVGQQVLKGELIGLVDGPLGATVHAPSSGTVTAIEPRPAGHLSGRPARCIELATDGLERWTSRQRVADYRQMSAPQLIDRIAQSGITGLGGGGFPTATKLTASGHPPIATVIVNATECEPYVTADESLMRERADEIIQGIEILNHIHSNRARLVIGIEQNKPEALAALRAQSAQKAP